MTFSMQLQKRSQITPYESLLSIAELHSLRIKSLAYNGSTIIVHLVTRRRMLTVWNNNAVGVICLEAALLPHIYDARKHRSRCLR